MQITKWLGKISDEDLPLVGDKAIRMARLYKANIPVPPAFIVTSDAFKLFYEETQITEDDSCDMIKKKILETDLPKDLIDELEIDYDSLQPTDPNANLSTLVDKAEANIPVIMRISTFGDLESGTTMFLVVGTKTLKEKLKLCWASFFSEENCRRLSGVSEIRIAVIISYMVQGSKSGISRIRSDGKIIVDACYGESIPVQAGAISYDSYVLDETDLELIDKEVREQEYAAIRDSSGKLYKHKVEDEFRREPVLSAKQAQLVAETMKAAHDHDPRFVQIEWMIEDGNVYVLKAARVDS